MTLPNICGGFEHSLHGLSDASNLSVCTEVFGRSHFFNSFEVHYQAEVIFRKALSWAIQRKFVSCGPIYVTKISKTALQPA
jgi:hypothetical protein